MLFALILATCSPDIDRCDDYVMDTRLPQQVCEARRDTATRALRSDRNDQVGVRCEKE